jgi:hypothetical protein
MSALFFGHTVSLTYEIKLISIANKIVVTDAATNPNDVKIIA